MRWTAAEAARTATFLRRATPLKRNCRAVIRSAHKSNRSKGFERFSLYRLGRRLDHSSRS